MQTPMEVSAAELRLAAFKMIQPYKGQKVGVVMRGDVPSACLYVSALDAGCDVGAVIYRPLGKMVDPYRNSKRVAGMVGPEKALCLDVEFTPSEHPYEAIAATTQRYGYQHIVISNGAEGHFASRREFRIYRYPKELFDAFRVSFFEGKNDASGAHRFKDLISNRGMTASAPFLSQEIRHICVRYGYDHLNQPRTYELLRRAYPELDGLGL